MPTLPANLISLLQSARVLVVGDTMLDRYWFGEVERISPEAPVPIAKIGRMDQRAGGAGNVARNIAALGGQAALLSVVGQDEAANELEKIVQSSGVQTFLERDETIATTVKLRVLSRNQQLLRIDFEEKPSQDVLERLNRRFRSLLPDYDAVILSDYGKGCLFQVADMIDFARDHNEKYAGAYLITPNRNELRQVVGSWGDEAELTEKAEALRRHLQLNAILLTRSEEGMSLYEAEHISHQPTRAQEVFDVSGAGDTVIATVGLGLAAGLDLRQGMDEILSRKIVSSLSSLSKAILQPENSICVCSKSSPSAFSISAS